MVRLSIGLFSFAMLLQAQEKITLSLSEAVNQALTENKHRIAIRQRIESSKGVELQAGLKPNLRASFLVENLRAWESPSFRLQTSPDTWGFLNQIVESGGKRERRLDLAHEQTERTSLEAELFERQLKLKVRHAYWAAAGSHRLVALAQSQHEAFGQLVENNRLKVKEGVVAEADLLRTELEQKRLEFTWRSALMEANRLTTVLWREIGVSEFKEVEFTEALEPLPPPPQEPSDRKGRPELKLLQQSVQIADANIRLQQANAKPDPLFQYGYKRTSGLDTILAGFQIDIPNRNKNQGNIAAASGERRSSELQVQAMTTQIEADVKGTWQEYRLRRRLLEESLPPMRSSSTDALRLARGAYALGGVDLLRLLDAQRVNLDIETTYIRTLIELRQAQENLEYALGVDQ